MRRIKAVDLLRHLQPEGWTLRVQGIGINSISCLLDTSGNLIAELKLSPGVLLEMKQEQLLEICSKPWGNENSNLTYYRLSYFGQRKSVGYFPERSNQ